MIAGAVLVGSTTARRLVGGAGDRHRAFDRLQGDARPVQPRGDPGPHPFAVDNPWRPGGRPARMAGVSEIEVVVAHRARATLRVGDVFLKVDTDQALTDVEVEAMALAPVPTPRVLWRKPPVL